MPAIFILVPNVPLCANRPFRPIKPYGLTTVRDKSRSMVGTISERRQASGGVPDGALSLSMLREARSDETNEIASVKVRIFLADNYREPTSSKFGLLARWFMAPNRQSHLLANWLASRESHTK